MYQMVYPWLTPDQFQLKIPIEPNPLWTKTQIQTYDLVEEYKVQNEDVPIFYDGGHWQLSVNEANGNDDGITIHSVATKFCQFIDKRDAHVVYHGPNDCNEKKYWNRYDHFHITYVSQTRPGCDKLWMNVTAQHKALSGTTGNIPPSQQTRYPASWANYLAQKPRTTWMLSKNPLMERFQQQTLEEYVPKEQLPTHSERFKHDTAEKEGEPQLHLISGKNMSLFKYVK